MAQAKATIDHDTIKSWVEERGGSPAHVKGSGSDDDPGILRIDFPGFSGKNSLEKISWESFFEAFEDNQLAFLYQDEGESRFSKLISRDTADLDDAGDEPGGEGAGGASAGGKGGTHGKGATRGKASSKGKGAAGGKATAGDEGAGDEGEGDEEGIDALELLEEQHREVEDLFEQLEAARSSSQKQRVFTKLANALAAHTKIEETLFYPAVFRDETESELREAVEEHLVAKRLIADMMAMEPSDPQFMSKAVVLRDVVAHHVEMEEQELFEELREQETDDLIGLGARLQERYQELMQGEPKDDVPGELRAAATLP